MGGGDGFGRGRARACTACHPNLWLQLPPPPPPSPPRSSSRPSGPTTSRRGSACPACRAAARLLAACACNDCQPLECPCHRHPKTHPSTPPPQGIGTMEELPRVLRAPQTVPINNRRMSKREGERIVREVCACAACACDAGGRARHTARPAASSCAMPAERRRPILLVARRLGTGIQPCRTPLACCPPAPMAPSWHVYVCLCFTSPLPSSQVVRSAGRALSEAVQRGPIRVCHALCPTQVSWT